MGNRRVLARVMKEVIPEANTFIGGVASSFGTISSLAVGLRISESHISNLVLDGFGNISCLIDENAYISPSFGSGFYYNNANITFLKTDVKGGLDNSSPRNCINFEMLDVPNFDNLYGGSAIRANLSKLNIRMNNKVVNASAQFYQMQCRRMYIPQVSFIGSDASYNNIFGTNSVGTTTFYLNKAAETINGGDIDGDFKWMRDNKGATLNFVDNATPPSAISNLSAGTITSSSVQLNFTPHSSLNPLDFYEVWIDDGSGNLRQTVLRWQEITASGQSITGLTPLTTYNIKIVACDKFWNRSEFSNEITVTTL